MFVRGSFSVGVKYSFFNILTNFFPWCCQISHLSVISRIILLQTKKKKRVRVRTALSAVSFLPFNRRSSPRPTTLSCCTEDTSTTPAVPISGSTVSSPNPRASYCLTFCERRPQLLGFGHGHKSPSEWRFYLTLPQLSPRINERMVQIPGLLHNSFCLTPKVYSSCYILQVFL